MIPQIIILVLWFFRLTVHMSKHGEPMDQKYNAGATFFWMVVMLGLYYWGGFFDIFWK